MGEKAEFKKYCETVALKELVDFIFFHGMSIRLCIIHSHVSLTIMYFKTSRCRIHSRHSQLGDVSYASELIRRSPYLEHFKIMYLMLIDNTVHLWSVFLKDCCMIHC